MDTATRTRTSTKLGVAAGVVALAGVIGITRAVVDVNEPGKVVRWEARGTNIMQVLVTKRTSASTTEYLVGSSRGPQLVGNKGGERPRAGYARKSGETTVAPGEVATIVVMAKISDPKANARSEVSCTVVTAGHLPVSHRGSRSTECSLTIAG